MIFTDKDGVRVCQFGQGTLVHKCEVWDDKIEVQLYEAPKGERFQVGDPGEEWPGLKLGAVLRMTDTKSIDFLIETLNEAKALHAKRMAERNAS